jgi:hypothetical protein
MPPKDYEYEAPVETSDGEGTVDDVARDILAEARLWEALQARSSIRSPFVSSGIKLLTSHTDLNDFSRGDNLDSFRAKEEQPLMQKPKLTEE